MTPARTPDSQNPADYCAECAATLADLGLEPGTPTKLALTKPVRFEHAVGTFAAIWKPRDELLVEGWWADGPRHMMVTNLSRRHVLRHVKLCATQLQGVLKRATV